MRPLGVVVVHPGVQRGLSLGHGGEGPVVGAHPLGPQCLVEPLHLAGGGGRVRGGEQVADAVVGTDPVKGHWTRAFTEASGEDLAVVGEDLAGDPMGAQGAGQGVAHGAGRGPGHQPGAHAEPGVVVDAGHRRELGAVGQVDAPHHVHLPQLHGPGALPALVVPSAAPALGRLDQTMAHQRPIDRRPPGNRIHAFVVEAVADGARAPGGVLATKLEDAGLDRRRHLVGTALGLGAAIGQPGHPVVGIGPQPVVHGLAGHAVAPGNVDHRGSVEHLAHRPIALLHQSQLHEHGRPPSDLST